MGYSATSWPSIFGNMKTEDRTQRGAWIHYIQRADADCIAFASSRKRSSYCSLYVGEKVKEFRALSIGQRITQSLMIFWSRMELRTLLFERTLWKACEKHVVAFDFVFFVSAFFHQLFLLSWWGRRWYMYTLCLIPKNMVINTFPWFF